MTGSRLALLLLAAMPLPLGAQRAPAQRTAAWDVDSTVDEMTDEKRIYATLRAARPVAYQWGTFVPELIFVCFPATGPAKTPQTVVRIFTRVSPTITDVEFGTYGELTLRFDSAAARNIKFRIHDRGTAHVLSPFSMPREGSDYRSLYYEDIEPMLLRDMLSARRLLVRYQLITDDIVTTEFRFGPDTRSALSQVLQACGRQPPP